MFRLLFYRLQLVLTKILQFSCLDSSLLLWRFKLNKLNAIFNVILKPAQTILSER